jgi:type III restriction enzyme
VAGEELNTLETEGQMLQRVMPDLMGMKNISWSSTTRPTTATAKSRDAEADDEDLKG